MNKRDGAETALGGCTGLCNYQTLGSKIASDIPVLCQPQSVQFSYCCHLQWLQVGRYMTLMLRLPMYAPVK